MRTERGYQLATTLTFLAAFALVVAASLRATDGTLVYTLDDPYIHLAVAENILHGGYGVNAVEFSSPSSSILFPFLLAAALAAGLGDWAPLLIGGVAETLTVWLVSGFFWRYAIDESSARSRWIGFLTAPLLVLSINAVALPMTGMEHPLHVLASVLVVIGLTELRRGAPVPWYLVVGILLSPLVRFEGIPLALAGILALLWRRHVLVAVASAATLALVFAFCAYAMLGMDLPILPSSVLVKSRTFEAAIDHGAFQALRTIVPALRQSFSNEWGIAFFIAIVLVLVSLVRPYGGTERGIVATAAVLALGAHIVFGRYGWFYRYEVYAVAIMILSLLYLFSGFLKDAGRMAGAKQVLLAVLLGVAANHYANAVLKTPSASRNIYEQQFQMHRFATDYFPHPVAVNDLGWVAYRNDGYVLDLWGLGSEEARRMQIAEGRTPASMERLTQKKGVRYAMIYDSWFREAVPGTWCRIAVLMNTTQVTAASGEVAFYLIDVSLLHEMAAALLAFRASLPKGDTLAILPCADRASGADAASAARSHG